MADKIIDKIRKLHAMAEGAKAIGSEQEAQAFAGMVNQMLNKHRLELTDIQFEEQRKTEPVESSEINWATHDIPTRKVRIEWIERLAKIVALAHTCDIMVLPGSSRIWLVGSASNRAVAEYLLVTLMRAAEKIAEKEYVRFYYKCRDEGDVTRARGYRSAFLLGFIDRINQRFDEAKRKMQGDDTGTALVRFNQEKADVSAFFIARDNKKSAHGLSHSLRNIAGYRDGQKKADDMSIDANAVNSSKPSSRLT